MASNILEFDLTKVVWVENKGSYMTQKSFSALPHPSKSRPFVSLSL